MLVVENAKIISNKEISPNFFVLELLSPKIAKTAKPGQFVNIRVSDAADPLLRRPISIYDTENDNLKILYFVKGKGTEILRDKNPGDLLNITGSHGNGFTVDANAKNILLVGGGFGTAPLAFLAKKIRDESYTVAGSSHLGGRDSFHPRGEQLRKPFKKKGIFVAIGGRTKELILCEDDFQKLGAKVFVTTDDGSYGEKGLVTKAVEKIIAENKIEQVFTVGPLVMMKTVAQIAERAGIPAQISMEERMACGVGACLGCVCKTKEGYQTVCENGPVFEAKELEL